MKQVKYREKYISTLGTWKSIPDRPEFFHSRVVTDCISDVSNSTSPTQHDNGHLSSHEGFLPVVKGVHHMCYLSQLIAQVQGGSGMDQGYWLLCVGHT